MKTLKLLLLGVLSQTGFASSYSVPVPESLADFAHYTNTVANGSIKNGVLTVEYELPEALVGKITPSLVFNGRVTAGPFINVSGQFIRGTCMRTKLKPLTCMLHYSGLMIDAASRDAVIKETFSGEMLAARMEVGRLFGNDPAGILFIDLAP